VINELWRNVWRRLKNNEGDAVRWAPWSCIHFT
jgi:hypothetical protein